jgi:MATE family multidrug resistance protein
VSPGRPWSLRSPYDREIARLAVPALGTLVADPLLSLVDTAFVGRLGGDALGALGVAVAAFAVVYYILSFVEYGTTSTVARAVGAGRLDRAGRATVTSFLVAAACGVAVAAGLLVLTGPVLAMMGASPALRPQATTYLRIRALAAPALLVVRAGHGAYRGYQDTRTPLVVTVGVNAVNLVLDPILIFGAGWGIAGAAWATVIAQWLGAAVFLALVFGRHRERLGTAGARPRAAEARVFLVAARDLSVRAAALLAPFTVSAAVAARVSDSAIAAHQVVFQVWVFLALALDAVAIAAQAMVGRYMGAGDPGRTRRVADRLTVLGLVLGLVLALVLAAVAAVLPGWFTDDATVIDAIGSVYWLLVASQPLGAAVFVWDGVFLGAGDFAYLAVATLGAGVAATGFLLAVLPLGWGLVGVWWGLILLLSIRLVTLVWRRVGPRGPLRAR